MNAFIEWLNSTEPCTPAQATGVICAFVVLLVISLTTPVLFTGRNNKNNNKKGTDK